MYLPRDNVCADCMTGYSGVPLPVLARGVSLDTMGIESIWKEQKRFYDRSENVRLDRRGEGPWVVDSQLLRWTSQVKAGDGIKRERRRYSGL